MRLSIAKSALKPQLLGYLRLVEHEKKQIIVTDRGRPVAKIIPFSGEDANALAELKNTVVKYEEPLSPVGLKDWKIRP